MSDPRETLARIRARADAAARTTVPALVDALEAVLKVHCPDHVESRDLCASCFGWDSEPVLWPCPTVKAITDALNGGAV